VIVNLKFELVRELPSSVLGNRIAVYEPSERYSLILLDESKVNVTLLLVFSLYRKILFAVDDREFSTWTWKFGGAAYATSVGPTVVTRKGNTSAASTQLVDLLNIRFI
jgi:hypothetical protein